MFRLSCIRWKELAVSVRDHGLKHSAAVSGGRKRRLADRGALRNNLNGSNTATRSDTKLPGRPGCAWHRKIESHFTTNPFNGLTVDMAFAAAKRGLLLALSEFWLEHAAFLSRSQNCISLRSARTAETCAVIARHLSDRTALKLIVNPVLQTALILFAGWNSLAHVVGVLRMMLRSRTLRYILILHEVSRERYSKWDLTSKVMIQYRNHV